MNKDKNKELKIIKNLMLACNSLANEVSQREATDWGLVSDALCQAGIFIQKYEKKRI